MANFKRSIYARKAKTDYEKSLLKATYHKDFDPPKEKHIQKVIWTLQGHNIQTPAQAGINLLSQRFLVGKWASLLKAEIILHRSLSQLGPAHCKRVQELNLPITNFQDTSQKGVSHSKLIQDYYRYIYWVAFNRSNQFPVFTSKNMSSFIKQLIPSQILHLSENILNQLESLVIVCFLCNQAIRNYNLKVVHYAAQLVFNDAPIITRVSDLVFSELLQRFFELSIDQAKIGLNLFQKFNDLGEQLGRVDSIIRELGYPHIQNCRIAPQSPEILASLRDFANGEPVQNRWNIQRPHIDPYYPPAIPQIYQQPLNQFGLSAQQLQQQKRMLQTFQVHKRQEKQAYQTFRKAKEKENQDLRIMQEQQRQIQEALKLSMIQQQKLPQKEDEMKLSPDELEQQRRLYQTYNSQHREKKNQEFKKANKYLDDIFDINPIVEPVQEKKEQPVFEKMRNPQPQAYQPVHLQYVNPIMTNPNMNPMMPPNQVMSNVLLAPVMVNPLAANINPNMGGNFGFQSAPHQGTRVKSNLVQNQEQEVPNQFPKQKEEFDIFGDFGKIPSSNNPFENVSSSMSQNNPFGNLKPAQSGSNNPFSERSQDPFAETGAQSSNPFSSVPHNPFSFQSQYDQSSNKPNPKIEFDFFK